MNWGLKIIIGLGAFMLFILSAGIYMVTQDTDTLEHEDYYEKSLAYNEVYQRKQNLIDDNARPTVSVKNDNLHIIFSTLVKWGDLTLKRASNGKLDKSVLFVTQGRHYTLPVSSFTKGSWQLEISLQHDGTPYRSDHNLYF